MKAPTSLPEQKYVTSAQVGAWTVLLLARTNTNELWIQIPLPDLDPGKGYNASVNGEVIMYAYGYSGDYRATITTTTSSAQRKGGYWCFVFSKPSNFPAWTYGAVFLTTAMSITAAS